jgi:hypothetical protein
MRQRRNGFTFIKVTRLRHISEDGRLSHEAQGSANSLSVLPAVLGIGFMFAPRQIEIDAVPADASPALIACLRLFRGPMLGIAVLNWMARNAEPSMARTAIVLGNVVGFGCVALMDVWEHSAWRTLGRETVPCDSSADDCRLRRGWALQQCDRRKSPHAESLKGVQLVCPASQQQRRQ